jgi:hypothetical protein
MNQNPGDHWRGQEGGRPNEPQPQGGPFASFGYVHDTRVFYAPVMHQPCVQITVDTPHFFAA